MRKLNAMLTPLILSALTGFVLLIGLIVVAIAMMFVVDAIIIRCTSLASGSPELNKRYA